MIRKHILFLSVAVVTLLAMVPVFTLAMPNPSRAPQEGVELLKNPGFEGINCRAGSEPGWCLDNWTHDVFDGSIHDNIFTPQGWVTWWRKGGDYGQPEVKTIPRVAPFTGEIERIRTGNYAVLLFTFYRLQDTGLYQVVSGLEPNSTVQLSAHAHGWSCDDSDGARLGYSCGDPWNQTFQVGIATDGNVDPFSPNIVWSQPQKSPDTYRRIGPATAQVGPGGTICVFLRSKTKWPFKYSDAYWDDASLVMTSPGTPPTATPLPPPPTPTFGPTPTPRATPTPRPDGATVHIVESGDTLYGIALYYDKDINEIRRLNATSLGSNDLIVPGQALVISLPDKTPTPTALPAPPTDEPSAPATAVAEVPAGGASICVLAYHDRNNNGIRDDEGTEELLPNAEFTVADASGVVARHTSDGVHEPHCFASLGPGAYRIIHNPPPGYAASGPTEWPVAVAEGTSLDVQFGNVRGETPPSGETTEPVPVEEESSEPSGGSTFRGIFSTAAKIGGILILILSAGVAVLFVLNRQRV
jgi:hypothetical protein